MFLLLLVSYEQLSSHQTDSVPRSSKSELSNSVTFFTHLYKSFVDLLMLS